MSFLKPFSPYLANKKTTDTMNYLGIVEDNDDPEKLGRIKVRIAPYTDFLREDLPWACPLLGSCGNSPANGSLNVPEVGSQVRVTFPSQDLTAPYYSGAELNEKNKTTFFDEDYPDTYGYKDSTGNFIKVNKARGTIQMQHSSTTNLKIAPDGSVQVTLNNGSYVTLDNSSNFEVNIGALSIVGTADGSLEIKANNEVTIDASNIKIKAGTTSITGDLAPECGANGNFMTHGNFVTVKNGLITAID